MSTEAFHKQFPNKEECFLAVLDEFVAEALDSVTRELRRAAPPGRRRVYRAMAAFVDYLVAHQALLRIAFIDIFEVGPGDNRAHDPLGRGLHRSCSPSTAPSRAAGPRSPARRSPARIWSIISSYVANDRLARLPCLVDHLAFIVLAPYIGPKAAVEEIQAARRPLRSV